MPGLLPGYITPKDKLMLLRKRATFAQLVRTIERGDWKNFLLNQKKAAHRYKSIQAHSGKIDALLVKVNVVRMAIRYHTMVLTGVPITLSFAEGYDEQKSAVREIRRRSMFDALLMQVARTANIDSWSSLRVDNRPGHGIVICSDSNATLLPVGPDDPDMQPSVWERRWIIERKVTNGTVKYLRVERHRAPDGIGMIEQEVYKTATTDLYQPLEELTRVELEVAIPGTTLEPLTLTGSRYPLITRLVHEYFDGQPEMLLSEHDMDMLDLHAAAMSRLDRTMEQHGSPKARVGAASIDPETNTVQVSDDAIIDPDKEFEYITLDFKFDAMLAMMNKTLQLVFAQLQLSPALVGVKLEGGAMPDTVDKLRLEANMTLARGRTSTVYFEPALQRVLENASVLDTHLPLRGYPIAPIGVSMHPGLPRDPMDIAREMNELRNGGIDPLVDRDTAVENIHGSSAAPGIIERLNTEAANKLLQTQQELMLGFSSPAGGIS